MYQVDYTIVHNYPETGAESDTIHASYIARTSRTAKQILEQIANSMDNADEIVEFRIEMR